MRKNLWFKLVAFNLKQGRAYGGKTKPHFSYSEVGLCVYDNCISIDGVKGLEIGKLYVIKTQLSIIPFGEKCLKLR